MYKKYFNKYIKSLNCKNLQESKTYDKIINTLYTYLPEEDFWELDYLINYELSRMLEIGYKEGFEEGRILRKI